MITFFAAQTKFFVNTKDPFFRLNLIRRDPDDNKFVDCAFACQADYIVTDDSHFNDLQSVDFPQITVKSLDQFLVDML